MTAVASSIEQHTLFARIAAAPPDPILGLTEAFLADTNLNKVNLGVGVYQNNEGKVPVLGAVREAEARWVAREVAKSYLPIAGAPAYRLVQQLLLGEDSPLIAEGRAVTVQGLGGTGALKVGADFLKHVCGVAKVWISDPSWENHAALFEAAGLEVQRYPYYDTKTHLLDSNGFFGTLETLPPQSLVLLHACCHNPTGVDLTPAEWDQVVRICRERALLPYLDFAYQGFAEGIVQDAYAVRAFAAAEIPCLIANSFSKSFALYGERVGALTLLTQSADQSRQILSQIKRVIRTNYSSPPAHGAQIVATILGDAELRTRWEQELTEMRERIHRMRALFVNCLREEGVSQDFQFIVKQRGMFSYSGLSLKAVRALRKDFGLYIVDSGRICVAALNDRNIPYVCKSIASVLSFCDTSASLDEVV